MYGRFTALGSAAAIVGFIAGAAAMGSYVEQQPAGPDAGAGQEPAPGVVDELPGVGGAVREVSGPFTRRACDVANLGGNGSGVPVVEQMSRLSAVTVDAVGGVTGGGECAPAPN